jgi:hypothetical protein
MRVLVWLSVLVICSPVNAQTNSRSSTDSKNSLVPPQKQQAADKVILPYYGGQAETLARDCKLAEKANLDRMVYQGPPDEISRVMYCLGFVGGIVDAETVNGVAQRKRFCVPDAATGGQLAKVIAKYGDYHPEKLYMPGVWFTFAALESAFPCE